jgi:hypothetical protein
MCKGKGALDRALYYDQIETYMLESTQNLNLIYAIDIIDANGLRMFHGSPYVGSPHCMTLTASPTRIHLPIEPNAGMAFTAK